MPRRRRVYILRIEDYLVDPPPSRLPALLARAALALLFLANCVLAFGWLFSLIPADVLQIAILGVIAYAFILLLFLALAKSINHVE